MKKAQTYRMKNSLPKSYQRYGILIIGKEITYNTYLLSSAKVMSAHTLTRATGLPCFLVVQWTDCLGWIDLETTEPLYVGWGGRIDRNDSQDMEPVMHYDILEFKRMEQKHESKII